MFHSVTILIFSLAFAISQTVSQTNPYVRGCYFTNWSQGRQEKAKYLPENYIPGLCTHIYYAFVGMNENLTLKTFQMNDEDLYRRIISLKTKQADLKVILSFGGWAFSEEKKEQLKLMVSNPENRQKFIQSSLEYVKKYGFDGLDMDWEVPQADDKINFANLLTEMSKVFHNNTLLLTAAVASYINQIDESYDVPIIAQALDMVNLMTYDIHGPEHDNLTGFNSPLFDNHGDKLSVSTTAEYWVSKGLPKDKVIIGFPTYGKTWTLLNPQKSQVGSPGTAGAAGPYTKEKGTLSYYEICDLLASNATRVFDNNQQVPYLVKNNTWVGYDDEESYKVKLEWLKNNGYRGAFIWTLDFDDFTGQCSRNIGQKYPLLNIIAQTLVQ